MTVLEPTRSARAYAVLWATVEAPEPPRAPTKAIERPTNGRAGSENRPPMAEISCNGWIGATRYSLTPRRISSR